jgi:hypothetical protein
MPKAFDIAVSGGVPFPEKPCGWIIRIGLRTVDYLPAGGDNKCGEAKYGGAKGFVGMGVHDLNMVGFLEKLRIIRSQTPSLPY